MPDWNVGCFLGCDRFRKLEQAMEEDGLSDEQKKEKRSLHAVRETEYLRLKRSKFAVTDFDPLKVIGRGAFGEVSSHNHQFF